MSRTVLNCLLSGAAWVILHVGSTGSGRALGPLGFWLLWQGFTDRYYRLKPVQSGAILKYTIRRYRGLQRELVDGTVLYPGDWIAELHIDNVALAHRLNYERGGRDSREWVWQGMRRVVEDMVALALPGFLGPEVKALHGVTLLASGGRRLGFEVERLPKSRRNDLTRFFMLGLMVIYNPRGRQRLASVDFSVYPSEVWLSRQALIQRYQHVAKSP